MNQALPALSLRQPWAWAVLTAGKLAENRTWATKYRGRIRIHSAKTWDGEGEAFIRAAIGRCPDKRELAPTLGAYVGEATVIDCWSIDDITRHCDPDWEDDQEKWIFGPVVWVLKEPISYPAPIEGRGWPGLYQPEAMERRQRHGW